MELFSGSGHLSAAMKKRGFSVFPVDHEFNTHKTAVSTVCLNLQDAKSQALVESMVTQTKPAAVHLGLPCGTCSRARDKPLPPHLRTQFHDPPPLRDANHLLGFPTLTGTQALKVNIANDLYRWGVRMLYLCWKGGIHVSIENPERSWLWGVLTLLVKEYEDPEFLRWFEGLDRVTFHMCMHGGSRAKNTRLLATKGLYTQLAAPCDGQHQHAPWGITKIGNSLHYDTAAEAEYPHLLCQRMADLLAEAVELPRPPCTSTTSSTSRRILGQHVKQAPPLVPEFSTFLELTQEPKQPNHKCLASHVTGENTESQQQQDQDQPSHAQADSQEQINKKARRIYRVGVQQEPQDFLKAATEIDHPMSPQKVLPDPLKLALFDNLTMDPVELAKSRMKAVVTIRTMAKELEQEECKTKECCPRSVKEVLSSKRIALWESLLKASDFPDMDIVNVVKQGAELTGEPKPSPLFPFDWKPAVTSRDELLASSTWRRKALQVKHPGEEGEMKNEELHKATMEEVELGHLEGPFTEGELDARFGKNRWLFNKRFALHQGTAENPKVRVIDDCRRSGLNSAYTTTNKLVLLDVDVLACALLAIADAHATGWVDLGECQDGRLAGPINETAKKQQWLGRTLDLSKAYKQVPLSEEAQSLCVLGYFHENQWKYYTTSRLPFGATSAVYTFNRISRSIHHILSRFLHVVCTCFYDDFPALSSQFGAGLVSKSMSLVLNLLGWDHAQVGVKATDFASEFAALGITVKLQELHLGSFTLANKEGRVPKIVEMLNKLKKQGKVSRNEASEIQGHLNFAQGFFTSRSLRFVLGQFEALSTAQGTHSAKKLAMLCDLTEHILTSLPPRKFNAGAMRRPFLLFTDGAWEDQTATAGLVLYDPDKDEVLVREIEVPDSLIQLWSEEVGEQLICQIELFAYMAARFEYRDLLKNRGVIAWLDNEAARFAASKGSAKAQTLTAMARVIQQLEIDYPTVLWVERVCSYSNPSDKPSRGDCVAAAKLFGATHDQLPIKLGEEILQSVEALSRNLLTAIGDLFPKQGGPRPEPAG